MQDTTKAVTSTPESTPLNCMNCGAKLVGPFCAHCGQRESNRDLRFSDLTGELARDFLHWDSGVWRTIAPLLFKPGFLTAEFIDGRKARYLPPLRLYLIISFITFLFISLGSTDGAITFDSGLSPEEREEAIERLDQEMQESDLSDERKSQIKEHKLHHLDKGIVAEPDALESGETGEDSGVNVDIWDEAETPAWAEGLEKRISANVENIKEDPAAFVDDFIERLPSMMFLLLPLFALLIKIAYLFSPFHYLQHLVFSLHYHSAVFLLVSIGMAINFLADYELGGWLLLWSLLYLPLALKRVYGSGYGAAIGKSLLIGIGEFFLLVFTLSGLAIVSVATL